MIKKDAVFCLVLIFSLCALACGSTTSNDNSGSSSGSSSSSGGGSTSSSSSGGEAGGAGLAISSNDIASLATINSVFVYNADGCTGSNQSPQLGWEGAGSETLSYAVTVLDTTADNFVHWIMYDIPSTTTSLERGTAAPTGATQVTNDYGSAGYGGPCPPEGDSPHYYEFKVWALDVATLASTGLNISTNAQILTALEARQVYTDSITATYSR